MLPQESLRFVMPMYFDTKKSGVGTLPGTSEHGGDLAAENHKDEYLDFPFKSILNSFSLPTVLTDRNFTKIGSQVIDDDFDSILYANNNRIYFKEKRIRDKFIEFRDKIESANDDAAGMRAFVPISDVDRFANVVRFKNVPNNNDKLIIAISVLSFGNSRNFQPIILRTLFGITPAESRLAMLLVKGYSATEAAEELGVRISTVREKLSSMFAKTRTSRQPELVSMLSLLELIIR